MTEARPDRGADERLSAWLDGELTPDEAAALRVELESDAVLAAELDDLARVRTLLRTADAVSPRPGVLERIVGEVARADVEETDRGEQPSPPAPVVALRGRRRMSTVVAVAAALAIVGAVVGGVGGTTTLPAVGDLVARHDAAASDLVPADSEPMPMDDMEGVGPSMPPGLSMTGAYHDDSGTVHLVYRDEAGEVVSVFRQEGDADVGRLPDGQVADMGGTDVWMATMDSTHVAVVDGDGYVWTVVADDDHDTMMVAMMDDLPSRDPSVAHRLRDAADAVVRPWRLG